MKDDNTQVKATIAGTPQLGYHPYDTLEQVTVVIVLE